MFKHDSVIYENDLCFKGLPETIYEKNVAQNF